jgi:diguanylate cyclase (GGDEF)-like protein
MGEHIEGRPGASAPDRSRTAGRARKRRFRLWALVAAAVLVVGIVAVSLAARSVAASNAARSREDFKQSSAEVASSLQLAIQRERDLIVNGAGFFLGDPGATAAQFRAWSTSIQAFQRYPELLTWGDILLVPAAKLESFAARFVPGDGGGSARAGSFHPIPAGARPYYCLAPAVQSRAGQPALPAGLDFCAAAGLIALRNAGVGFYGATNLGHGPVLALDSPFYRGGAVPRTVAARRAAFAGWMGITFKPSVVLDAALLGHPETAVALRYRAAPSTARLAASDAVFRAGKVPRHAQSVTIAVHDGWTVQTFGPPVAGGVFADGSALAVLIVGTLLSLLAGVFVLVLGTGRAHALRLVAEQTEELRDQAGAMRYQAMHDPLTGLPNRTLILDRIEQLLARNRRAATNGAALYVDLDEFKNVNDTLGHAAGDRLLVAAAARLKSTLRDADTIGRMGGDEFVVLIEGGELTAAPELVAQRLLDVMRQPFDLGPTAMSVSVNTSIGIAVGDRANASELLRDADIALYQAKAGGKNRYQTFEADMQAKASRNVGIEDDLRSALQNDEFRLVYQPIYDLADLTLVGVEALLRWEHPTLGILPPSEFIPILEATGQIREVGHWVLRQACRQMAAWQACGDTLDLSVNVSGAQFDSDAIVDEIRDALAGSGLAPTSLIVEVTETTLMRSAEDAARRLRAIKDLGVKIAIDDFGTGYSSLAYLQQFPVDCLKIDRMFTNAIASSPESNALIRTLVQLGRDLGLRTLAEGVETPGQLDRLRGEHVNEVQGFLLSRPLDALTLETEILAPIRPGAPTARPT